MPSTSLLYHRESESSPSSPNQLGLAPLAPVAIALIAILSLLVLAAMACCIHRFWPGWPWRRRASVDGDQPCREIKQTFLDLDDAKTLTGVDTPVREVKQTFLHLDDERSIGEKRGLGINLLPAFPSSKGRVKRKHGSNSKGSLDSTSSITPLVTRSDAIPPSPPRPISPRSYSPRTPPPVPEPSTKVRISPIHTRPLPTPVQPVHFFQQPSRYDISPLQSSTTIPDCSRLPMSFLIEIDAKREDQTEGRSQTVSPLQHPRTPTPDRKRSESQLSSRNVSPISAPSMTPVITYPSVSPLNFPRPFSKYNPYRPPLEPAPKNWPLDNMIIPEHTEMRPGTIVPIRKHLAQSSSRPQGTTSPIFTTITTITAGTPQPPAEKEVTVCHPDFDARTLQDLHRRRRQQLKAREENQEKRKAEREKGKQQAASLKPAKKFPFSTDRASGKASPPNPNSGLISRILQPDSHDDVFIAGGSKGVDILVHARSIARSNEMIVSAKLDQHQQQQQEHQQQQQQQQQAPQKKKSKDKDSSSGGNNKQAQKGNDKPRKLKTKRALLPPRLPSKSRKPSQSPDAYERARRISGVHELVGSPSEDNRGGGLR